jgi:hypothetical protein
LITGTLRGEIGRISDRYGQRETPVNSPVSAC